MLASILFLGGVTSAIIGAGTVVWYGVKKLFGGKSKQ